MPEGGRRALHAAPAEAPVRHKNAEEGGEAGGGGENTGTIVSTRNQTSRCLSSGDLCYPTKVPVSEGESAIAI